LNEEKKALGTIKKLEQQRERVSRHGVGPCQPAALQGATVVCASLWTCYTRAICDWWHSRPTPACP
jgi:hypothetical protein